MVIRRKSGRRLGTMRSPVTAPVYSRGLVDRPNDGSALDFFREKVLYRMAWKRKVGKPNYCLPDPIFQNLIGHGAMRELTL